MLHSGCLLPPRSSISIAPLQHSSGRSKMRCSAAVACEPCCFTEDPLTPPQVSDLTGSYRLYRKECLDRLMALCTSKVENPSAALGTACLREWHAAWHLVTWVQPHAAL